MEYIIFTRKGIRVVDETYFNQNISSGKVALLSVYQEVTTGICFCVECVKHFSTLRVLSVMQNPEVSASDCLLTSPNLGASDG